MEANDAQVLPSTTLALPDLERLTTRKIREKYLEVFGVPTHSNNRGYLLRRLTERPQPQTLPVLLQVVEPIPAHSEGWPAPSSPEVEQTIPDPTPARDPRLPPPGSVLTRVYKGHEHRVTVLENGFEYEGELYSSLSKIAKVIAGCCWNGFSFFLLGPRKELQQ